MLIKKLLIATLLVPVLAFAWEPTKPVTVVIGNTPGAGNEMAFRKLAEIVQKRNPNFVYVVQNIPGADSVIANNKFLEAVNDGHIDRTGCCAYQSHKLFWSINITFNSSNQYQWTLAHGQYIHK